MRRILARKQHLVDIAEVDGLSGFTTLTLQDYQQQLGYHKDRIRETSKTMSFGGPGNTGTTSSNVPEGLFALYTSTSKYN